MSYFRILHSLHIQWSDDEGRTWHDQDEPMPKFVLMAWWELLTHIERTPRNGHTSAR